jgi:hypothetical protein
MNQRLVWNFEFSTSKNSALSDLKIKKEDDLKWEARFFWPESKVIKLSLLDDSLLEIAQYQHKQKQDQYYLIAEQDYNIKSRRGELLYKPLLKHSKYAFGFGAKINISELNESPQLQPPQEFEVQKIMNELKKSAVILVKKDSFTYRFSFNPPVKLELARIVVNNQIYFSVCVEGKSRDLVEMISIGLLGKKHSSNYVRFLKKITQKQ